jgi:hypothetical protein
MLGAAEFLDSTTNCCMLRVATVPACPAEGKRTSIKSNIEIK